ncbi:MAG TPA: energy-coupling factor transporter transmembrane component T, partial [Anaerolineae bacterium]|nr:energy-coupling factor transporter transmembrane component T [Anaerolineae bacterium]
ALLGPLTRIGLPVREFALVLTIALRFVPTLFEEIDKIAKAQRARGADPGAGGVRQRVRGWTSVFVPIFISAFRRADELATAMEARGFRGTQQRTRLYQLRLTRRDLVAALVVVAACLAIVGLERLR